MKTNETQIEHNSSSLRRLPGTILTCRSLIRLLENGEGYANLLETSVLSVAVSHHVVWAKNKIDLQDLAIKRWVDRLSMDELAIHFICGRTAIVRKLGQLRLNPDFIKDGRARSHVKSRKYRFMDGV